MTSSVWIEPIVLLLEPYFVHYLIKKLPMTDMCLCVVWSVFFIVTNWASTIPSNILGCQFGTCPVCWEEKISEEQLHISNESIKNKVKAAKRKEIKTKRKYRKG